MSRNTCAADARPANMRRTEGTAAVPAKPPAMSPKACARSAAAMPAAPVPASAAARPAATAAAGVGFECEKRHDEEQHRGHASANRQHKPHGAMGLDAPHRRGRLSLGIPPRTKSFYD